MRGIHQICVGGLFALSFCGSAMALQNTAPAGYQWQTVWSDEFNYTGSPDSSKWNIVNSSNVSNQEEQAYTNRTVNSYVSGGHLTITALKEQYTSGNKTSQYTSARLNTSNKFSVQYGRIEASIKMPGEIGAWPAFWTLGQTGGWPAGGEIDIVEYSPGKTNGGVSPANYINRNFIYKQSDGQTRSLYNFTYLFDITPTDGYHTYAVEWDENWMRWYYDDILFATSQTTPSVLDAYAGTKPSSQPHYLLLNLAMGGTGGGGIDPNFTSAEMLVDYVRVSKLTAVPEPASVGLLLAMGAGAMLRRRRISAGA